MNVVGILLFIDIVIVPTPTMGRKCCVTNCNGNYDVSNKEKTFRLPHDDAEHKRWLAIIPRDNIPDSKGTVVCERH